MRSILRGCQTGLTKGGGTHSAGFPNFLSDTKNQTKNQSYRAFGNWNSYIQFFLGVVGAQEPGCYTKEIL